MLLSPTNKYAIREKTGKAGELNSSCREMAKSRSRRYRSCAPAGGGAFPMLPFGGFDQGGLMPAGGGGAISVAFGCLSAR